MNILLEYAYLRTLDVKRENVCELLTKADYLSFSGVVDLCCDYLRANLSPENCIGIMCFAKEYFCEGLEKDARLYIMRNFVLVIILLKTLKKNYANFFFLMPKIR